MTARAEVMVNVSESPGVARSSDERSISVIVKTRFLGEELLPSLGTDRTFRGVSISLSAAIYDVQRGICREVMGPAVHNATSLLGVRLEQKCLTARAPPADHTPICPAERAQGGTGHRSIRRVFHSLPALGLYVFVWRRLASHKRIEYCLPRPLYDVGIEVAYSSGRLVTFARPPAHYGKVCSNVVRSN
jgi:hypothetical protein